MNENLNSGAIRELLNRSVAQLDQGTITKLRDAREHALQRASARARSPIAAWIGGHIHGNAFIRRHAIATGFAAALLVIGLIGGVGYYWQQMYNNNDEVDIAILTDDLPINYYVN
jgi:hypothetical protein